MKKLVIIFLAVSVLFLFIFPSMVFAEDVGSSNGNILEEEVSTSNQETNNTDDTQKESTEENEEGDCQEKENSDTEEESEEEGSGSTSKEGSNTSSTEEETEKEEGSKIEDDTPETDNESNDNTKDEEADKENSEEGTGSQDDDNVEAEEESAEDNAESGSTEEAEDKESDNQEKENGNTESNSEENGTGSNEEETENKPVIYTELNKYYPQDTVPVKGEGFNPGEKVQISFYNAEGELEHGGEAVADSNGKLLYEYKIEGSKRYKVVVKTPEVEADTEFDDDPDVADYVSEGPSGKHTCSTSGGRFYMEYFVVDIYEVVNGSETLKDDNMYSFCVDLQHYLKHNGDFEWNVIDFEEYNENANDRDIDTNNTIHELPPEIKALAKGIDKDWIINGSTLSWLDFDATESNGYSVADRTAALQAAFWDIASQNIPEGQTKFDNSVNSPNQEVKDLADAIMGNIGKIPMNIDLVNTDTGDDETKTNYVKEKSETGNGELENGTESENGGQNGDNTHSFTATVTNYNQDPIEGAIIGFSLDTINANVLIENSGATNSNDGSDSTGGYDGTTGSDGKAEVNLKFVEFFNNSIEAISTLSASIDINSSYSSTYTTEGGSILYPKSTSYPEVKNGSNQALIVIDEEELDANIDKIWRLPGEITVEKTDSSNGEAIDGAEFSLQNADGSPAKDAWGNDIENQTTDGQGQAKFDNLAWGEYKVVEVNPPTGYEDNNEVRDVDIDPSDNDGENTEEDIIKTESVENTRLTGSITVNKVDDTGSSLDGATFTLYDSEGNIVSSGSGATVIFSGLEWGIYTLSETGVPAGYTGDGDEEIEINRENVSETITITMTNTPIPPSPPDTPDTPPTDTETTVDVEGIEAESGDEEGKEVAEVLGIEELPYTGYDKMFLLFGLGLLLSSGIFFSLILKRKNNEKKWKHVLARNKK